MSKSGMNRMVVPVGSPSSSLRIFSTGEATTPARYCCAHTKPSRKTVAVSSPERALTADTPTPCRPPLTL